MPTIRIREEKTTETGFDAVVSFEGGEYPVTIIDPFTPKLETELEWYFETWLQFPFADTVRAQTAANSIRTYGEQLFQQAFPRNSDAYSEYRQVRGNLSQLQIEIVGKSPEFQALHWEALHDPDLPRPLAVDCVLLRKSIKPTVIPANVQPSPVINLLVVVARPDEERDVGYRTISRPLVELIESSRLRVNVELLRPGTYEALSKHLEAKRAGFYHIIHLDMHGALLNYQQVKNPHPVSRYFFKGRYGREELKPFEGEKAFLAFEGENQGLVDLVEASELANLLTGKGIPVCILNACQSGKQVKNEVEAARETSLGSQLMTSGMQMVVAMGYSVTVSAARLMMEQLYQHLFNDQPIAEAIRLSRVELWSNKERKAYSRKSINLEDWLLPVVYYNQPIKFNLTRYTPEEEERYWESLSSQYKFDLPTYGFIGRDLEILKIEKALLKKRVVLLQGMGGTGKTTLLNYLREWWQKTSFVENVFYFGYDLKAWKLEQILFTIGQQVYGRFEQAQFQAMNQAAQTKKLVATLRSKSYAVILDNLESVTGEQLAIQHTLGESERNLIRDFIRDLVGGQTLVVLGSRSQEKWLQEKIPQMYVYEIRGLDQEARSELAEKILERNVSRDKIDKIRQDGDFQKLIKVLAGYPLAMEVILANLGKQSPQEILQGLQVADINLDIASNEKTESIIKCIAYSYQNLSASAQKLLTILSPFSGFIFRPYIPLYVQQLQNLSSFVDYELEKLVEAIQEAINWGLLSPMSINSDSSMVKEKNEDLSLLTIHPTFPYFLKTRIATLDKTIVDDLKLGFKNHYLGIASNCKKFLDSKDQQERKIGISFCQLEYENLYNALQICIEKQESISIYFCLDSYFGVIQDRQNQLRLAEMVFNCIESYPPEFIRGELCYQIPRLTFILGNCQVQAKQYDLAKKLYQKSMELNNELEGLEENQKQLALARTYHQLGSVAQELREYEEARSYYLQVLSICTHFGDRYFQAPTYHNLGIVAQELREYKEAQSYYRKALSIYSDFGDRFEQADTYQGLGRVAQELREYKEAWSNYLQALSIYSDFGDRYSQASTYQGLGMVAQELRDYEEAWSNYLQALSIKIDFGDRFEQASTYHQLGMVAQELKDYEEARSNYLQALSIKIDFGDRYEQAGTYYHLGILAAAQEDYPEARSNLQEALERFVEYKDEYGAASVRKILESLPP